jgi:glycosyltransferase involved in cell wall biosynthesis
MVILTGFYNAENYIEKSLLSIMGQRYKNFKCYITHDMSTDKSVDIVKEVIKNDDRFILLESGDIKLYQSGNFDRTIRFNDDIDDNEVIVEVDGDDWLPDSNVFTRIHELYSDPNVWIANGSFKYSNGQLGFAQPQTNFDNLRTQVFTASHIRTWRAFLWRKIKEEDLKDENGNYWQWSGDLCFMFPMLEMSGEEHYRFMRDINYVYNAENPINEHKINLNMVSNHSSKIRAKQPYKKI